MKENIIVVLENNERYVILNKLEYNSKDYYFAMGIKQNLEIINNNVVFLEEKKENNNIYIAKVNEESILINLIKLTKDSDK